MTRQEAAKLVTVMLSASGQRARLDRKAVDDMIDAYAALLADLDYARCNAAVRVLLQSETWVPSVASIRKAVLELELGPVRPAGEAWGDVRLLQRFQGREAIATVDQLVFQVCQAYGWVEWRTLWRNGEDIEQWHVVTSDNEAADRARFIELYDKLKLQERREQQVPLLAIARESRERGELASAGDLVAGLLRAAKESPKS